jgi:exodeoxyribonuclease VII large subunit
MARLLDRRRADFRACARALPSGEALMATPRQRLDQAGERLAGRVAAGLRDRQIRLASAAQKLARHSPQAEFARTQEKLKNLGLRLSAALAGRARFFARDNAAHAEKLRATHTRLRAAQAQFLARRAERVAGLGKLLDTLGYRNVLARGYALVRDAEGRPLRLAGEVAAGARLAIEFADGAVAAIAEGGGKPLKGKAKGATAGDKQGTLF